MGLSREFLKGLELDKSTIDAIKSEYGAGVTGLKEQIETLKEENGKHGKETEEHATLKEQYRSLEKLLKNLEVEKTELLSAKEAIEKNGKESLLAQKEYAALPTKLCKFL